MKTNKNNIVRDDLYWMSKALKLAKKAELQDEVPVGAVLVVNDQPIAWAFNKKEQWHSPLGHAELMTLQKASQKLKKWRLSDATLYVTLEPCVMCAGALIQARIKRLVYGTKDPKGGAIHSLFEIGTDARLNHRLEITEGILQKECSEILSNFFKRKRKVAKP